MREPLDRFRATIACLPMLCLACPSTAAEPGMAAFERLVIDAQPPKNPWIKAVGDLDGDGDLDVIVGGVLWYENPRPNGDPGKGPWKVHRIGSHHTHDVEVADLDKDGTPDVVVRGQSAFGSKQEGRRIVIFKQLSPTSWSSREIACPDGEGLKVADLNGDGRPDVVVARMHQGRSPQEVSVYLNADRGRKWTKLVVSTKGSHNIVVADLDGDGRPDILGANHGGPFQPVEWWRNGLLHQP